MKDAILKGTGDSRYLKSKIPTGTTWEQALAMLNAGTFPVDINGINTEGFQQVGTPLNKANLLKDAVVSKLGMIGDKTPNDMFGVLADCGNLHVWRKTVTITEEVPAVPAGYTLGDVETNLVVASSNGNSSDYRVGFTWASAVVVDPSTGAVSLGSNPGGGSNYNIAGSSWTDLRDDFNSYVVGNFCVLKEREYSGAGTIVQDVLFVPSGSVMTRVAVDASNYQYNIVFSKAQRVTGYPYTPAIPAGTHVTYPVSTNRNAYQEGSNAKPAGYTLGDAEKIILGDYGSGTNQYIKYSDSVSVTDTGVVSLSNISGTVQGNTLGESNNFTTLKGKFISTSRHGYDVIFFVPVSSTLTTAVIDGDTKFSADCQPVTGYPAIGGNVVDYVEKRTDATDGRIMASDYQSSSYSCVFETASSIEFDDSGNISLVSPIDVSVYLNTTQNPPLVNWGSLIGKYIRLKSVPSNTDTYFPGTTTVGYIDSTATISAATASGVTTATITSGAYLISSTPVVHGESMEYLGCLGDKARVQVLSYVGTGTYGVNNPTSLMFSFKPKIVFVTNVGASSTTYMLLIPSALSATYTSYGYISALYGAESLSDYYAKIEDMTVSYYASNNSSSQANVLHVTYTVLAIG